MKISSSAFENNHSIPPKYTCDGEDVNPPLSVSDVPDGAKSLVLIMDDPDAIAGVWDHWIVFNINPEEAEIKEKEIPEWAVEAQNSFGRASYGGPCPPSGNHHYRFNLYALDKKLDLDSSAEKSDILNAMDGHVLAQAVLIGLYSRE